MSASSGSAVPTKVKPNQNFQVFVRVRPLNATEHGIHQVIEAHPPREILHINESKGTKKYTFDRTFRPDSKQHEVYETVVGPLIEEVLSGYNCTVFAYGQTGTGKTHTMVGTECADLKSSWNDISDIGIIPRAASHLFDELLTKKHEFSMRISYLELYNEKLCDLLASEKSTPIKIFDDSTKKGSVIIQGLEEIPVHSVGDVYKLLEKGKEGRKTAKTRMNPQSSRSHTIFSIFVHIKENEIDGVEMLRTAKLNLVDLAGSEENEKGIQLKESKNINRSLVTLARVITAVVNGKSHIPYRDSKLTRLLQETLSGRTKTSIIATISPGHKDIAETLRTLEYAHRAKSIRNSPEINRSFSKKTVLKEYTEEINKLKGDFMAARDKNDNQYKLHSQNRKFKEKLKALEDELAKQEEIFNEVNSNLAKDLSEKNGELVKIKKDLKEKKVLLDCRVRTEEKLRDQAFKLLEVADIATSDTFKLHDTINRRRDVDHRIQSACADFTNRMKESFDLMGQNLQKLEEDHTSHLESISKEFSKSKQLEYKFLTDAMGKVESISIACFTSLECFSECIRKHLSSLSSSSNDHRTPMHMLSILRIKEIELKSNLQQNLAEMRKLFEQQRSSIDRTVENIKCVGNDYKIRQSIEEEVTVASELCQKILADLQTVHKTFKEEACLNIEKCKNVCNGLESGQTDVHKDVSEKIEEIDQSIESSCKKIYTEAEVHRNEIDVILKDLTQKLSKECDVLKQLINEEKNRLEKQDTVNNTLTSSLQKSVKDYAYAYNEHVQKCMNDIHTFRTSETKPYTSSGQTPYQRKFDYSRELASTSSHSQIVQRMGQKNDFSDCDMTINEDSEIGSALSDTEGILNSTPLELNPPKKSQENS